MKKLIVLLSAVAFVFAACEKGETTDPNTLVYDGVTYKTVTLTNGQTWMAENLRYVPKGVTVSSDPSNGSVWYPYSIDAETGTCTAESSADSVKKYGLLYSPELVFGVEAITDDNYKTFEGAQGICPKGWHVPSRSDYLALCGNSNKAEGESATVDDNTALFYDATYKGGKVQLFNEAGFNFVASGAKIATAYNKVAITAKNSTVTSLFGLPALTYYWASTGYKGTTATAKPQFFALMSTYTLTAYPEGRLTLGYSNTTNGCALRCVKDSVAE